MKRRILFSDNGTLIDESVDLNNYHSGDMTFSFVSADDALYIGSDLPFNHLFIKLTSGSVNAETSTMIVQYWDDDQWRNTVELIDETASGGATLAQDGFITFTPDKDYLWTRESTNYSGEEITGLTSVTIYDLYWIKITTSADLTADVKIEWIGQKFSNDEDLYSEYPEFNNTNFKAAFESGKSTWEEQHVRAAGLIVQDLFKKGVISGKEQILERDQFMPASVCKVAEIIYNSMGDDYKDQRDAARKEYYSRIGKISFRVDKNNNAIQDETEKSATTGYLER